MKILTIGYYDDFARFFLSIKRELKSIDKNIEFKYLSLYLSGYLYFLVRLHQVSFFSFGVWTKVLINKSKYKKLAKDKTYKGIDLDKIILYHKKLNPKNEIKYKLQAIAYIDTIEELLQEFKPDILILSGDSRMSVEILNIKAKELNIKTYYFEQGPFGTTILDNKGVNANAGIRSLQVSQNAYILDDLEDKIKKFFKRERSTKYKRNPFYRGSDYIFESVANIFNLLPPDIKMEKRKTPNENIYSRLEKKKIQNANNCFLLILQVPFDVNMVYHSPFYANHFEIVKDIYENLPENSELIVREHPLYKGRYEDSLYNFMSKNNIPLDTKELYSSIEEADVVIVNNSTVGIEAIAKLKSVVVLGNSYYDRDEICLKLKDKNDLKNLLQNALIHKVDKKEVLKFLNHFLYNYLIDGHFRDRDLKATRKIIERILQNGI